MNGVIGEAESLGVDEWFEVTFLREAPLREHDESLVEGVGEEAVKTLGVKR